MLQHAYVQASSALHRSEQMAGLVLHKYKASSNYIVFIFSDWSEKMFLIYKLEDFNAPFTKVKIANVLY